MKTKIEAILFQAYELGVQQADCDLTEKANTIITMLANQRVIEELESLLYQQTETKVIHSSVLKRRIIELNNINTK